MHERQTENWPRIICQLVRKKDIPALRQLQKDGISLNILQGEENALRLLAMAGDIESVEFLLNIFQLNKEDAITGYALSGYVHEVNRLIESPFDISCAILGYARAGHVLHVKALQKLTDDHGEFAARGYAMSGNKVLVEEQLAAGANCNMAIGGYARGGYFQEVQGLIKRGASLDCAVLHCARGGHTEQVNLLVQQGASLDSAVYGYAKGGYISEASELILQGASRDEAIEGYASSGHINQVNALLKEGASIDSAINGYSEIGEFEEVNKLIRTGANPVNALSGYVRTGNIAAYEKLVETCPGMDLSVVIYCLAKLKYVEQVNYLIRKGQPSHLVIQGYAEGGYQELVDELLVNGGNPFYALRGYAMKWRIKPINALIAKGADRATAAEFYSRSQLFNQETILRLMACTEDRWLRHLLANKAEAKKFKDIGILKNRAVTINKVMQVYALDFPEAQALTIEGFREWILQGIQLFKNKTIPIETFFLISFFVTGLKEQGIANLVLSINKKLLTDTKAELTNQWESGFFHSRQDYDRKLNKVEDNYQNRIQFPDQ